MLEKIKAISDRLVTYKNVLTNEEITKTSLVLPFIGILGFDHTNPLEVLPEFHADYPEIKADKVDYCIMINNQPTIIIECKKYQEQLDNKNHKKQLAKYFQWLKPVEIAILTNGVEYQFYSDLKNKNMMDSEPFFTFNINKFSDNEITVLSKFVKDKFNVDEVRDQAHKSSATGIIFNYINQNFNNPNDEYVTFILKQIIDQLPTTLSVVNQKVKDIFRPTIIDAHQRMIQNVINERLQAVIVANTQKLNHDELNDSDTKIVGLEPTLDELNGYNIITAISAELVDPERIFMRNANSYSAILLDDNNRKWIARLYFKSKSNKYLEIRGSSHKLTITKLSEIYKCAEQLKASINLVLSNKLEKS